MVLALLLLQIGVSTGSVPDTVTVGERFRSAIRVSAPPGTRVQFPARMGHPDTLTALGTGPVVTTTASGAHTAVYSLVAWTPGTLNPGPVAIRIALPGRSVQDIAVSPRLPFVRPVLPADTAGVRPRPLKDVWGPGRYSIWPWLLLGAVLFALVGAWMWRRALARRGDADHPVDPLPAALAALNRLHPEPTPAFYAAVAAILREYLAAHSVGRDLTTSEALRELRPPRWPADRVSRLAALLAAADRIKFARESPTAEGAQRLWSGAQTLLAG